MTADAIAAPLPRAARAPRAKRLAHALYVACLVFLFGVPSALFALKLVVDVLDPYYRAPSPNGMMLRVAIGPTPFPAHRVAVEPAPGGRSAIRIRTRSGDDDAERILEVDYPSGVMRELEPILPPAGMFAPAPLLDLDFDGDGTPDRVRTGPQFFDPNVEVVSGATDAILFRHRDPLERTHPRRAFPLGDLDGDGVGELALVHPRDSRRYDFHPANLVHDVTGWVTVVSGARSDR